MELLQGLFYLIVQTLAGSTAAPRTITNLDVAKDWSPGSRHLLVSSDLGTSGLVHLGLTVSANVCLSSVAYYGDSALN